MPALRKFPEELRERAIRPAMDARKDPATRPGALRWDGEQLGINPGTAQYPNGLLIKVQDEFNAPSYSQVYFRSQPVLLPILEITIFQNLHGLLQTTTMYQTLSTSWCLIAHSYFDTLM